MNTVPSDYSADNDPIMRRARVLGFDTVSELVDQLAAAYERGRHEGRAFYQQLFTAGEGWR